MSPLALALALTLTVAPARTPAAIVGQAVDVGAGRSLWLVCGGPERPGRPTVILISGYHDSADPWTEPQALSLLPGARGPPVLPALAVSERVCAYDRPGTLRYVDGLPLTDRTTPTAQPRTVAALARELHDLLAAAAIPGPYVLAAHSLGGMIALDYARTWPGEVRGLVFIDALAPTISKRLGPLWPLYRRVLDPPPAEQPLPAMRLAASETVDIDAGIAEVDAAPPLPAMPVVVLTKTEPFRLPPRTLPPGLTAQEIDAAFVAAQDAYVALAPATPHIFATGSEHYIQLSQPDLVVAAVKLVLDRAVEPPPAAARK